MGWERELAASNRAKAKAAREQMVRQNEMSRKLAAAGLKVKMTQADMWMRVDLAIGQSFPDGDPIDDLGPWMERHNVSIEQIDRAVNRFAKIKTGMYGYLAMLWNDRQADEMADAKVGVPYENNAFWFIQDGKVVPYDNPWSSA